MPNLYVGSFRDLLKVYYKKETERNDQRKRVMEMYSPEFAEGELAKLRDLSEGDRIHYKNAIRDIFTKARDHLSAAATIRPEALTADRIFFQPDSGFRLTRAEVERFIEKYRSNSTMTRLIGDWLTSQEEKAVAKNPSAHSDYEGLKVITPQDQVSVYQQIAASALNVADKIYAGNASEMEVNLFADESFASDLFSVIGDGRELDTYSAKYNSHCFDNIDLTV